MFPVQSNLNEMKNAISFNGEFSSLFIFKRNQSFLTSTGTYDGFV